jgi:hypothetical protein
MASPFPMVRMRLGDAEEILTNYNLCQFEPILESSAIVSQLDRLNKSGFFQTRDGSFSREMVALASAEFAFVREASIQDEADDIKFPFMVTAQDVRVAIAKYNTTSTYHCRQKERVAKGEIHLSDVFLFTGDLQKYERFFEGQPDEKKLDEYVNVLNQNLNDTATELAAGLLTGKWAEFQVLLWKLRLWSLQEYFRSTSQKGQKEEAAIAFREKWNSD